MTGHAADGRHNNALFVFIKAEIFFVDLRRHLEHMAGDLFLRLGIAGKIQSVGSAVLGRSMTEITFYSQSGFPVVHDLVEVFMADVLWQDLQIPFWPVVIPGTKRRTGCGHSNDHQGRQREYNCKLFTM